MASKPQVLIVDDDPRYLELLQFALESEGFQVLTARHPRNVQALAVSYRPDIVISDVAMPDMDGFDVAANLRADPRTADIPVIFLSARNFDSDRLDGRRSGAVDYVSKPFSTTALIEKVRFVMKEVP